MAPYAQQVPPQMNQVNQMNQANQANQANQPMIMSPGGYNNGTYVAHHEQGPYKIYLPNKKTIEIRTCSYFSH